MQLTISTKKAGLDHENLRKARRLLQASFTRLRMFIAHMRVFFDDINGPRGGVDKRCRLMVKLTTSGQVVVQEEGASYLHALNNAINTMVCSLWRKVGKRKTLTVRKKRNIQRLYMDFTDNDD